MLLTLPSLPLIGGVEFSIYDKYKEGLKKGKGINCELEFLKKQVMEEKLKMKIQAKIGKVAVETLQKNGCLDGMPRSEQMDMFDLLG